MHRRRSDWGAERRRGKGKKKKDDEPEHGPADTAEGWHGGCAFSCRTDRRADGGIVREKLDRADGSLPAHARR